MKYTQNRSQLRYISKFAAPTSPHAPYRTQVMHLAGSGNFTYCGRQLSDPYTVFVSSGHRLCEKCSKHYARQ